MGNVWNEGDVHQIVWWSFNLLMDMDLRYIELSKTTKYLIGKIR